MTGAHCPQNQKTVARGFTMVELLVVIGIIGLAAATALPNLAGYVRASRMRSAQDSVASALQRARNLAIMKNTQMGITFITQNNITFWVHIEDSIAGVTAGNVGFTRQGVDFAAPNAVLSTRYVLPPGIEFATTAADCPGIPGYAPAQASLRFDRYGLSTLPPPPPAVTALGLVGGSATTPLIYAPAVDQERSVCLIDRRTTLRRWLQISPAGRIARR